MNKNIHHHNPYEIKKNNTEPGISKNTDSESIISIGAQYNTTYALGAVCLWALFGFFNFSCDIGVLMNSNLLFRHLAGIISFFFLFSIIKKNTMSAFDTWSRATIIYIAYLMLTKCEWWVTIPVILLLMLDQTMKIQQEYDTTQHVPSIFSQRPDLVSGIRDISTYLIYILIIVGFIMYIINNSDKMPMTDILFGYVKCQ